MITTHLTGNIGNWISQYSITRILAEMNGWEFGFDPPLPQYTNNGLDQFYFMNIDMGIPVSGIEHTFEEHWTIYQGKNISTFDKRVYDIQDNTCLIGYNGAYGGLFQSETYYLEHRDKMLQWFSVKDEYKVLYIDILREKKVTLDDRTCVINFRGGEYRDIPEVLLGKKYWSDACLHMTCLNPYIRFICITDDVELATEYMPFSMPVIHEDIGFDYWVVNNAHWLIISNSSFGMWAAWLNQKVKMTVAPKYWANFNSGEFWQLGDQYYKDFTYLSKDGLISNYDTCKRQAIEYYKQHNILHELY